MGIFARSLGLARVTPVVGGYAFMYPHSLSGLFSTISSDPWIARRDAQHADYVVQLPVVDRDSRLTSSHSTTYSSPHPVWLVGWPPSMRGH